MDTNQSGFVEVNGASLYYEIQGAGETLVLVHAGIADNRMWDGQIAAFAERYRVVRFDMRGFGQSAVAAGQFRRHDDLFGLLGALGIERAHLLGCSMGGRTIVDFALEHPAMAASLITVGSAPSGFEHDAPPPPQWPELEKAFEARDLERVSELEIQMWVDGPDRGPDVVAPAVRRKAWEMNLIALQKEVASPEGTAEQPAESPAAVRLGRIGVPTLVIIGDRDRQAAIAGSEALARGIPGARHAVMAGTAHLPNMERPDEFNRIVLEFLG